MRRPAHASFALLSASLVLVSTLTACASRPAQGGRSALAVSSARPAIVFGNHIEAVQQGETLREFLLRRAPNALRLRDPIAAASTSPFEPPIGIYINGNFAGGVEVLESILATDVITVRRLTASAMPVTIARHHSDGILDIRLRMRD